MTRPVVPGVCMQMFDLMDKDKVGCEGRQCVMRIGMAATFHTFGGNTLGGRPVTCEPLQGGTLGVEEIKQLMEMLGMKVCHLSCAKCVVWKSFHDGVALCQSWDLPSTET